MAKYDELTCLHEASHGVAAIVLGRRLTTIHVCQCGSGYVDYTPMKIGDPDEAVIRLAGATAVAQKLGHLPKNHGLSQSDRLGLSDLSEADRQLVAERTAKIVLANWAEIEKLAGVLAKVGTLSEEQLNQQPEETTSPVPAPHSPTVGLQPHRCSPQDASSRP